VIGDYEIGWLILDSQTRLVPSAQMKWMERSITSFPVPKWNLTSRLGNSLSLESTKGICMEPRVRVSSRSSIHHKSQSSILTPKLSRCYGQRSSSPTLFISNRRSLRYSKNPGTESSLNLLLTMTVVRELSTYVWIYPFLHFAYCFANSSNVLIILPNLYFPSKMGGEWERLIHKLPYCKI